MATVAAGNEGPVAFRAPSVGDAASIRELVRDAPNLELNSAYAYLLACRDFRETSVVARSGDHLAGFVAAYRRPPAPDTLFVWQVGVAAAHRESGLGRRLLLELLEDQGERGVRFLEATVTGSNEPSQRLFRSVARALGAPCEETPCFTPDLFPEDGHETETLFRIGPFAGPRTPHSQR